MHNYYKIWNMHIHPHSFTCADVRLTCHISSFLPSSYFTSFTWMHAANRDRPRPVYFAGRERVYFLQKHVKVETVTTRTCSFSYKLHHATCI